MIAVFKLICIIVKIKIKKEQTSNESPIFVYAFLSAFHDQSSGPNVKEGGGRRGQAT